MKRFFFSLSVILTISVHAQCPTEAILEDTSTKTVPTDGTCDSPADDGLSCSVTSAALDLDGTLTVLSCATLTLSSTGVIRSNGTIVIEEGGTLIVDNTFRLISATSLTVNGTLVITNGNFAAIDVSHVDISSTGKVDVLNGSVQVGFGAGSVGSMTIDGTLDASGNFTVNNMGTLDGSGLITFGGTYSSTGTEGGVFSGCTGTNSSCGDTSLPVELISFGCEKNPDALQLVWSTASELNNEGFHIERSFDGKTFERIGFVKGNGTTNTINTYTFIDHNTQNNRYYRLLQTDYDGTSELHKTIFVEQNHPADLSIYPNPFADRISLTGSPDEVYGVKLISLSGKTLYESQEQKLKDVEADLNNIIAQLSSGTSYLLTISTPNSSSKHRILKK